MKIKILAKKTVPEELEVTLPLYREHDVTDERERTIFYHRITFSDGMFHDVEIEVCGENLVEVSVNHYDKFRVNDTDQDYVLGRGRYQSSREAFARALEKVKALIVQIDALGEGE